MSGLVSAGVQRTRSAAARLTPVRGDSDTFVTMNEHFDARYPREYSAALLLVLT
jgi:hypothetical protein